MYIELVLRRGILAMVLSVALCATLAFAQTDEVVEDNARGAELPGDIDSFVRSIDAGADAAFDLRIQQIREDAQHQVADLQAAMQSRGDQDRASYLKAIGDVKRDAEISILDIRQEQELARGNVELAEKFARAAEMMQNPVPRVAPDPAADQARFEERRTDNSSSR